MDAVDGLRDGSNGNLFGVALKDVEGDAGQQRIAHGGLLGEVVLGREFGAFAIPCSPLIDDELHFGLAFGGAHGVPVVGDDALHDAAPREQIVVVVAVEVQSVAGGKLGRAAGRVVVDG